MAYGRASIESGITPSAILMLEGKRRVAESANKQQNWPIISAGFKGVREG